MGKATRTGAVAAGVAAAIGALVWVETRPEPARISGFVFPRARMPPPIYAATFAIPVTYPL